MIESLGGCGLGLGGCGLVNTNSLVWSVGVGQFE